MKTQPGATITGAYYLVHDIEKFMRRKRTLQCVILDKNCLPRRCALPGCRRPVTSDNRTDIIKVNGRIKVACFHYKCAWSGILNKIYGELYERLA